MKESLRSIIKNEEKVSSRFPLSYWRMGLTRHTALNEKNVAYICVDLNGIYNENAIFPTGISTMYYDNETVKRIYDELKKIFRKRAAKTVNNAYICPKAYEHKGDYRFCTIDIKSPPEYDLDVKWFSVCKN